MPLKDASQMLFVLAGLAWSGKVGDMPFWSPLLASGFVGLCLRAGARGEEAAGYLPRAALGDVLTCRRGLALLLRHRLDDPLSLATATQRFSAEARGSPI